jgi:hypothetical protein
MNTVVHSFKQSWNFIFSSKKNALTQAEKDIPFLNLFLVFLLAYLLEAISRSEYVSSLVTVLFMFGFVLLFFGSSYLTGRLFVKKLQVKKILSSILHFLFFFLLLSMLINVVLNVLHNLMFSSFMSFETYRVLITLFGGLTSFLFFWFIISLINRLKEQFKITLGRAYIWFVSTVLLFVIVYFLLLYFYFIL